MLRSMWDQFVILFASGDDPPRVLNGCAPWFFGMTQRAIVREVMLGIARLTDQPTQGSRSNLVLASLLNDPALLRKPGLRRQLEKAINRVLALAAPIRKHRNKYLAHLDHATALGARSAVLPGVTAAHLSRTMQAIERAYNVHCRGVHHSSTSFEMTPVGDAKALLRVLSASDRWRTLEALRGAPAP